MRYSSNKDYNNLRQMDWKKVRKNGCRKFAAICMMVLLVCSGALLSAVGIYRPLADFAGAGASVPLIGFGHVLWEGMKKAIEEDGILGLFTGGFTACAAGISSALIFSYLASLFFRPKMKK